MKNTVFLILMFLLFLSCSRQESAKAYYFDEKGISREVLENYLDRSITMVYLLIPDTPEGKRVYSYHADDVRMVKNLGAKFLGRALYRWGGESKLNDSIFWNTAKRIAEDLHNFDSDIIIQGCLFEVITREVDQVKIPGWVFQAYGLPIEERCFSYDAMLNQEGKLVDHWHMGSSVPDITRLETQLWFYYLAASYMNVGCEAFHLGQIELIGMNDPERNSWAVLINKIREYAGKYARRKWVLLDAHTPYGGMVKDGISLLDFNSFPMRIKELPEQPYRTELAVNHLDALYCKSEGCISPSGWKCEHLPYLVEFDNYGRGLHPNVADLNSHFVWGWDEISWFAQQPEDYRNEWLKYAWNWIRNTDLNGHLEMPGCRMITCPNETGGNYRANTRSVSCPIGYAQEETIKILWDTH